MTTNRGNELWKKAKKIIPGGSQLLSKRSEMFLPDQWPSYYEKAKGVEVWDLDNKKYIDMSIMGIGACTLGYADDDVNTAVIKAVQNGSMCTLNCWEEEELAELLLKLNPWAQMVRYARTGGEAVSIAVRIARAYSKKDKVAFCGYHGWHDWYLASNLADNQNLDGHLLPGLQPLGVPRALKGTAIPFNYNHAEELEKIVETNDIGTVVLEPIRNFQPNPDFLPKVKKVVKDHNIVLIIDEISAGWRLNVGGAHRLLNIEPDIAVYAKAMSNGYPMAAIVGKNTVMDAVQESFVSSTYWTERIGPVASLATINKMVDKNVPAHLNTIGEIIFDSWKKLANENGLQIKTSGITPLPHFEFDYIGQELSLKTLFTQEMLNRGYLASTGVYVSYAHSIENVQKYNEHVNDVFKLIKTAIDKNTVSKLLKGPIAHTGFKRLA